MPKPSWINGRRPRRDRRRWRVLGGLPARALGGLLSVPASRAQTPAPPYPSETPARFAPVTTSSTTTGAR